MADIVDLALSDLVSKLKTITEIKDTTVKLYMADEVLKTADKLQYPAVAVIYAGMRKVGEESIKHYLDVDVFVASDELCNNDAQVNNLIPKATTILASIREVVSCTSPVPGGHNWKLQAEVPAAIEGKDLIGYAQRWRTIVSVI